MINLVFSKVRYLTKILKIFAYFFQVFKNLCCKNDLVCFVRILLFTHLFILLEPNTSFVTAGMRKNIQFCRRTLITAKMRFSKYCCCDIVF